MSKSENKAAENLVWLDMEMSGLEPKICRILELALVVTNQELELIDGGLEFVVHQTDNHLETMDEWNQSTHSKTGLVPKVRLSSLSEFDVEKRVLSYLEDRVPKGVSPLCGSSIHQDRRFLRTYMPNLDAYFSYRNIDVSTVKELCKRWNPALTKGFVKKGAHSAMADVLESIEELKYYRANFLRLP